MIPAGTTIGFAGLAWGVAESGVAAVAGVAGSVWDWVCGAVVPSVAGFDEAASLDFSSGWAGAVVAVLSAGLAGALLAGVSGARSWACCPDLLQPDERRLMLNTTAIKFILSFIP
ncbi:MAG: hypothetical protein JOY85_10900 [Acidobacteriaceae bacterium]|nr:hypothetical protein [Acidobacteriaceae bacterium]